MPAPTRNQKFSKQYNQTFAPYISAFVTSVQALTAPFVSSFITLPSPYPRLRFKHYTQPEIFHAQKPDSRPYTSPPITLDSYTADTLLPS
jgi:hypothetical protein